MYFGARPDYALYTKTAILKSTLTLQEANVKTLFCSSKKPSCSMFGQFTDEKSQFEAGHNKGNYSNPGVML